MKRLPPLPIFPKKPRFRPVLIFHGTKDRTLNIRQSIRLYEKLKVCKKDAMLYLIEGADHGGAEFWTEEVCGRADAFMKHCMEQ